MTQARKRALFIAKRLLHAVPVIFGIVVVNFLLLQFMEGDAVDVLAGEAASATPEYMAQLREKFGLDQPVYVQLWAYVRNVVVLDLGYSFRHDMPVVELIMTRFWPTMLLMTTTLFLAITIGVILGLLAASGLNRWRDTIISVLALVSYATPLFWVGLMLVLLFSVRLGWLPTSGMETIAAFHEGWDRVLDIARHMVMPVTALSLFYMAAFTRLMRASMLEQANMDYVTTARAKGLTERRIVWVHVLRNALLPVLTMGGVQVANMLGGSIIIESVFGWPGMGLLAFEALFARDINLLLGIFLFAAVLVVAANLIIDILYTFLDPRIELA
ncbi:MAG: ABC transporter permease [Pseudomonadota bacterium]